MKATEIQVGRTYLAKVSGRVVPVTVTAVHDERRANGTYPKWRCRNELTGREVWVRSSQRFRGEAPVRAGSAGGEA